MARISFNRLHPSQLITVQVNVGGITANESRSFPVGLDTGATFTAIPTKVALDLGYDLANPKKMMPILTGNGIISLKVITVRQLTAIGETVEDIDVVCLDLPASSMIKGLLGLNFLERFDIEILFSTNTIEARPR